MDIPKSYQYYPKVPLSDLSDLYSVGNNRLDGKKVCIVSYLPKVLRVGNEDEQIIKNNYLLFIEDTTTVDSIRWDIQLYLKGEKFANGTTVYTEGNTTTNFLAIFDGNLFNLDNLSFDKLIVSCEIIKGNETITLSIEHLLVKMLDFDKITEDNNIKPGWSDWFWVSNRPTTNYLLNCVNDYLTEPVLTWNKTDILGSDYAERETLLKIVCGILYFHLRTNSKTTNYNLIDLPEFDNENIRTHLNTVPEVAYDGGFRNGIGSLPLYLLNDIFSDVTQVPNFSSIPDTDKLFEIFKDNTLINKDTRPEADDSISGYMNAKVIESKERLYTDKPKLIDLYNLTLFPKSSIKLMVIVIKYIFECSKKNECNECLYKEDSWKTLKLDQIKEDQNQYFLKNILNHYTLGPAGKVDKIIKPAKKIFDCVWSMYVDTIVNNKPRIVTAYFAKKVVKLINPVVNAVSNEITNSVTTCHFERLDSQQTRLGDDGVALPKSDFESILGRQVYLVVETLNSRGKQLVCNVRPSGTNLTGSSDNLTLVIGPNGASDNQNTVFTIATDFNTIVGECDALYNTTGNLADYSNVNDDHTNSQFNVDHIDKAIIKIHLRPSDRATFDVWATNLSSGTAKLEILAQMGITTDTYFGNNTKFYSGSSEFLSMNDPYDPGATFSITNRITYEIFHTPNYYNYLMLIGTGGRRNIGTIENEFAGDQIIYFYHDHNDNEHEVCSATRVLINEKGPRQSTIPSLAARGAQIGTLNMSAYRAAGENIDASLLTFYANGTLTNGNNGDRWYPNTGNQVYMINADIVQDPGMGPANFSALDYNSSGYGYSLRIAFLWQDTRRRSANPDVFAGIIGALAQLNLTPDPSPNPNNIDYSQIEIISEGLAYEDGSCYPSTMHRNGEAYDTHYIDEDARFPDPCQQTFVDTLFAFGFMTHYVSCNTSTVGLHGQHTGYNHTTADNGTYGHIHDNHMHSQSFDHVNIQTINS